MGPETAGKVSGIAYDSLYADFDGTAVTTTGSKFGAGGTEVFYSLGHVLGTWLGTGTRTSTGPTTDAYAGTYGVIKLNL
jgi:hypothetical protein